MVHFLKGDSKLARTIKAVRKQLWPQVFASFVMLFPLVMFKYNRFRIRTICILGSTGHTQMITKLFFNTPSRIGPFCNSQSFSECCVLDIINAFTCPGSLILLRKILAPQLCEWQVWWEARQKSSLHLWKMPLTSTQRNCPTSVLVDSLLSTETSLKS